MPRVELTKPFLWLKLAQFILGIMCYGLYFKYVWGGSGGVVVPVNFTQIAAVAFPFVILPVVVVVSFLQGEGLADHLICALLSVCGFLVSLIGGSLTFGRWSSSGGATAAGVMSIIMSVAYLLDMLWYGYSRFRPGRA